MNSRQTILKRISKVRTAADVGVHPGNDFQQVPMPPAAVSEPGFDSSKRFTDLAAEQQMTVATLANRAAVPGAIQSYMRGQSIKMSVCISPELQGKDINWSKAGFPVRMGAVVADGDTLVSECYAAVAEGGVLVVASSANHVAEADYLAET
ncbi:MAG: hypothetical protein ACR2P6_00815, partial [Gammaproteobacteria bacterium]